MSETVSFIGCLFHSLFLFVSFFSADYFFRSLSDLFSFLSLRLSVFLALSALVFLSVFPSVSVSRPSLTITPRRKSIEFPVLHPPKDVLRLIAADAEIETMKRLEQLLPDFEVFHLLKVVRKIRDFFSDEKRRVNERAR